MDLSGRKIIVTGGAGFIGSHLVDKLIDLGNEVTVIDNLSGGKREFLEQAFATGKCELIVEDLFTHEDLPSLFQGHDAVFHLAANADVKRGAEDTGIDLEQNVQVTHRVLDATRAAGIKLFVFTSTSTVYGNASEIPTPEEYGPCLPISLYGASKLAAEGYISAFADLFEMDAVLFRFANCVGPRSTHGVTFDFVNKLRASPNKLVILGDGKQKKSYFHVTDCIDAIIFGVVHREKKVEVFNVGSTDYIDVTTVGECVVEAMGLENVEFEYTGGTQGGAGWKGDVKVMLLGIDGLAERGWRPKYDSRDSVLATAKDIVENG